MLCASRRRCGRDRALRRRRRMGRRGRALRVCGFRGSLGRIRAHRHITYLCAPRHAMPTHSNRALTRSSHSSALSSANGARFGTGTSTCAEWRIRGGTWTTEASDGVSWMLIISSGQRHGAASRKQGPSCLPF